MAAPSTSSHRSLFFSCLYTLFSTSAAWECISLSEKTITDGVVWKVQNCTSDSNVSAPLLKVNSIHIDLTKENVRLVAQVAPENISLGSLPTIASYNPSLIAGINGGYFWRVDVDGFWRDNVCRGKTRKEAEQPASPDCPNCGIGDGTVIIDGVLKSSNCNCTGFNRPALLTINGEYSNITVLDKGAFVDPNIVHNAISAGPNLVSYDETTGSAFIDIPADDENVNRIVYEASTAVGLIQSNSNGGGGRVSTEAILVTTDGSDSCHFNEHYCGIRCQGLASLMLEVFGVSQAMSMDQGGSTTMWIDGEGPSGKDGVVSNSDNTSPGGGGTRALANGLFVELL
jgi:exopolysaccharide biosynthesis protein